MFQALTDIISLSEVFKDIPDPEQTLSVEYIPCNNPDASSAHICVFGILETKHGLKIKQEMLQWLTGKYNVYCISQKPPGTLFEYPALYFAQWLCKVWEVPYLLYVHTKGAACNSISQKKVRSMWKNQFTWNIHTYLQHLTDGYDVVCPLLGPNNETWYNGMFISASAFKKIPEITLSKDRYTYQRLFYKSPVKSRGILKQGINATQLDAYILSHSFNEKEVKNNPDFSLAVEYTRK